MSATSFSAAPLITIGIPTFNRFDATFRDALRSALAQTYPHLEVLVCDNASDDGTAAFMATQQDPRLRYHRHDANIGANANFNSCLDLARGSYFLLLHDDDILDPSFITRAVNEIGDGETGVALGGTRVIDANGRLGTSNPPPEPNLEPAALFLSWFERRTSFYLFSTLFHAQTLRNLGGFSSPENLFQDVVAIARLTSRCGYVSVPGNAGAFRRHQSNLGGAGHPLRWTRDSEYLLDVLCDEMPAHADELRAAGAPYLAAKCYRYVTSVRSPIERWEIYRDIERRFGYTYSPWSFLAKRYRRQLRASVGRWLRRARLYHPSNE